MRLCSESWLSSMIATPKIIMMARMPVSPVYLSFMETYLVERVVSFR